MIRRAPWLLLLLFACGDRGVSVFVPADGPRPGGGVSVMGGLEQRSPALSWMGDGALLAWSERGLTPTLNVARIGPEDTVVSGMVIQEGEVSDVHLWPRPGADWLLSLQQTSRVGLWSITTDLEGFDHRGIGSANSSAGMRAIRFGGATYAAWTGNANNDYDVWGGFIDDDNRVRAGTDGSLTPGNNYEYAPALAQVGDQRLLVWERFSSMVNYNYDVTGRWLDGSMAGFELPAVGNQDAIVAVGGESVALIVWHDTESGLVATRARPDGTLVERAPVKLWPSRGARAAVAAVPGGFLIAGPGLRDGVTALRLLMVDETSRIEPDRAVWLAEGELGNTDDGPALIVGSDGRGLIAFAHGTGTSTAIDCRRIALRPPPMSCRRAAECLTSRCVSGQCAE
ncbi:MAG: hypothetical protein U1E65_12115 [Myxococcota bacterium]